MAACFLFLWGLGGYYVLRWLNGYTNTNEEADGKPLLASGSIGDSLNALTGGRLTGFMETSRAEKAKGDISGFSDENTPPRKLSSSRSTKEKVESSKARLENRSLGKSQKAQGQQPQPQHCTADVPNPTAPAQKAMKGAGVEGKVKTAASTAGAAKGVVSGATWLG